MYLLIWYFLAINLLTFFLRGIDKRKAVLKKRRISEKTLLYCCACGGRGGALFAMGARKHKTVKSAFLKKFYLIVGTRILLLMGGYLLVLFRA